MYNLLKLNSTLISATKYNTILLDNDYVHIGNYRFNKNIVNDNGEFIGDKYKKFLWFKFEIDDYGWYKYAITNPYLISFYDGRWAQNSKDIKKLLQDAMNTGLFTEEVNKLLELLNKAKIHIEEQNQILINLEKKLEVK